MVELCVRVLAAALSAVAVKAEAFGHSTLLEGALTAEIIGKGNYAPAVNAFSRKENTADIFRKIHIQSLMRKCFNAEYLLVFLSLSTIALICCFVPTRTSRFLALVTAV